MRKRWGGIGKEKGEEKEGWRKEEVGGG